MTFAYQAENTDLLEILIYWNNNVTSYCIGREIDVASLFAALGCKNCIFTYEYYNKVYKDLK